MAVIVMNWELGADLGHVGRFMTIALHMRDRGHRPVMLLSDVTRAAPLLEPRGLEYMQAPVCVEQMEISSPDMNHADTLLRFGFSRPEILLRLGLQWRVAWAALKPDILMFDYAPTAMLAARGLNIPRVVMGNSFDVPPKMRPVPRYRWWMPTASRVRLHMQETERQVTFNSNVALKTLGGPSIQQISDIYDSESTLICGDIEMDVYGARPGGRYIGAINSVDVGIAPSWPPGQGDKIFAYLKPSHRLFDAMIGAMSTSDNRFLVFAPGMTQQSMDQYAASNIMFSTVPFKMLDVLNQCTSVICHGGGLTDVALSAAKPLLLLPNQLEQLMTCHRVVALGAGMFIPIDGNPAHLPKILKELHSNDSLAKCAASYAQNHLSTRQEAAVERLLSECESILNSSKSITN